MVLSSKLRTSCLNRKVIVLLLNINFSSSSSNPVFIWISSLWFTLFTFHFFKNYNWHTRDIARAFGSKPPTRFILGEIISNFRHWASDEIITKTCLGDLALPLSPRDTGLHYRDKQGRMIITVMLRLKLCPAFISSYWRNEKNFLIVYQALHVMIYDTALTWQTQTESINLNFYNLFFLLWYVLESWEFLLVDS